MLARRTRFPFNRLTTIRSDVPVGSPNYSATGPRSSAGSLVRTDSQTPDPRRYLTPLLLKFTQFGVAQYANLVTFCANNPSIFDEDPQRLEATAKEFASQRDEDGARRAAHRYLLFKICSTKNDRLAFLVTLTKSAKERDRVSGSLDKYLEEVKATVSVGSVEKDEEEEEEDYDDEDDIAKRRSAARALTDRTRGQPTLSSSPDNASSGRHTASVPRPILAPVREDQVEEQTSGSLGGTIRMQGLPSDVDTTWGGPSLIGIGRAVGLSPFVTSKMTAEVRDSLEKGFKVYEGDKQINKVLCAGSLIAVYWHENLGLRDRGLPDKYKDLPRTPQPGRKGPGWVTIGEGLQVAIYSHVRRFIIVEQRAGFSIGVPITSYGNKGLVDKKLPAKEIRAHAIVYAHGKKPTPLANEPTLPKEPICINITCEDKSETISGSSRLYYAKPQSIDHNIKIKHLGYVCRTDKKDYVKQLLLDYQREHALVQVV